MSEDTTSAPDESTPVEPTDPTLADEAPAQDSAGAETDSDPSEVHEETWTEASERWLRRANERDAKFAAAREPYGAIPYEFDLDVDITAEDIENGVPGDGQKCPGALAVKRALHEKFGLDFETVSVGYQSSHAYGPGWKPSWRAVFRSDHPLNQFIVQFDRKDNVPEGETWTAPEPISFTLHFVNFVV